MKSHTRFTLITACTLAAVSLAHAQTLTWDGNSTPGISNVAAAWDAVDVWSPDGGASNSSWSDGSNVVLTASGSQGYVIGIGTVNTGPYVVNNLSITTTSDATTNGIQLATSPAPFTVTLNGAATTGVGSTGLVNLLNVFQGPGSFTIGGGDFRLVNNSNSFLGGITLNGGTLRVGNGNGVGNPQTSGSLGAGTLTINGGTIYQDQGNGRTQAVPATINAGFTFTAKAGGGLTIGGTTAAPVNIGNAVRTLQVAQNVDGTGANSVLGLRNLYGGSSSGIVKTGAGVLLIESRKDAGFNFTGTFTLNNGELRLSAANAGTNSTSVDGDIGATRIDAAAGTVLRIQSNEILNRAATVTLAGGNYVSRNSLGTNRRSGFQKLQISGTCKIDIGSGILLASSGATGINSLRVGDGGTLGGNGTLRMGTGDGNAVDPLVRPSYLVSGETFFNGVVDADVTLGTGATAVGIIKPGTSDALDSTIGTLSLGNLLWNGGVAGGTVAQMAVNLGAANASDKLSLSGALTKGTGSSFVFDFLGSAPGAGTYTLIQAGSVDANFVAGDFSHINLTLAGGETAEFLVDATTVKLKITAAGSSPYDTWADGYSLVGTDRDFDADPDLDGVVNLLEYAQGGLPDDASSAPKPVVSLSGSYARISFTRIADAGLVYKVWASSDLANWGVAPIWTSTGASNVAGTVDVEDTVLLTSGASRFLMLEVLRP